MTKKPWRRQLTPRQKAELELEAAERAYEAAYDHFQEVNEQMTAATNRLQRAEQQLNARHAIMENTK